MLTDIDAIFFDIDDTLFDRERAQDEILRVMVARLPDALGRFDWPRLSEAFAESDRLTLEEYYAHALAEDFRLRRSKVFLALLGLDETCAPQLARLYVEIYPTVDVPVPGARRVVRRLAERYPLGVVSNGLPDVQYRKLETIGLAAAFACIVLSEELGVEKPDPAIFLRAAERLDAKPSRCLHVGDLVDYDVLGAKRAGMQACWLNPTGEPAPPDGPRADAEIKALAELPPLLGLE